MKIWKLIIRCKYQELERKKKKQLRILSSLLVCSLAFLPSCASIPLEDKPICVEITHEVGSCTNIVSGKQFNVDEKNKYENKTWWEQRHLMLQLPISTWVELKSWIIKVCKKHKKMCKDSISSWDRSLEYVDEAIERKGEQ